MCTLKCFKLLTIIFFYSYLFPCVGARTCACACVYVPVCASAHTPIASKHLEVREQLWELILPSIMMVTELN